LGSRQPGNQPTIQNRFRNDPEANPGPIRQRQQIGHFESRQPGDQPTIQKRFRNDPKVSPGPSRQRQQIDLSNYQQNLQLENIHFRLGSSSSGSNQPRDTEGRRSCSAES